MHRLFCLLLSLALLSGIYDFSLRDTRGNAVNLSDFRGKKMLFVNVASSSGYVGQLASLEQLYQKYKDSLVVIAIPSNTFQGEPKSNAEIEDFMESTYHAHFIVTEKTEVAGAAQSPLYSWLTHQSQNAMMENSINEDFFKFLVNGEGTLVGAFAPSVDPMSQEMQRAITN